MLTQYYGSKVIYSMRIPPKRLSSQTLFEQANLSALYHMLNVVETLIEKYFRNPLPLQDIYFLGPLYKFLINQETIINQILIEQNRKYHTNKIAALSPIFYETYDNLHDEWKDTAHYIKSLQKKLMKFQGMISGFLTEDKTKFNGKKEETYYDGKEKTHMEKVDFYYRKLYNYKIDRYFRKIYNYLIKGHKIFYKLNPAITHAIKNFLKCLETFDKTNRLDIRQTLPIIYSQITYILHSIKEHPSSIIESNDIQYLEKCFSEMDGFIFNIKNYPKPTENQHAPAVPSMLRQCTQRSDLPEYNPFLAIKNIIANNSFDNLIDNLENAFKQLTSNRTKENFDLCCEKLAAADQILSIQMNTLPDENIGELIEEYMEYFYTPLDKYLSEIEPSIIQKSNPNPSSRPSSPIRQAFALAIAPPRASSIPSP